MYRGFCFTWLFPVFWVGKKTPVFWVGKSVFFFFFFSLQALQWTNTEGLQTTCAAALELPNLSYVLFPTQNTGKSQKSLFLTFPHPKHRKKSLFTHPKHRKKQSGHKTMARKGGESKSHGPKSMVAKKATPELSPPVKVCTKHQLTLATWPFRRVHLKPGERGWGTRLLHS